MRRFLIVTFAVVLVVAALAATRAETRPVASPSS